MHATSQSRRSVAERRNHDPERSARRRNRLIGVGLIAATLLAGVGLVTSGSVPLGTDHTARPPAVPNADVTVNFAATTLTDDPAAMGVDESTYGTPSDINDSKAQELLKRLGVGYARLWLTVSNPADPSSRIVCAAAGCDTGIDIDRWVQMMEAAGETPVIGIPDTLSGADAAAIVTHFTVSSAFPRPPVDWVVGNEPEAIGEQVATYEARFNALYDAMKAVAPAIKIGGPATLGFDQAFLQQFLADCGSRADFVDFHFYPAHEDAAQLLAELPAMSADLSTLRAMIKTAQPGRAADIAIHVGEWNFSADPGTLAQFAYTGFAAMLDADLLGRILTAGADGLAWGSKNGPMSLLYGDVLAAGGGNAPKKYKEDTPMPLYEAIGMFTGAGLFPRFGTTIVSATSKKQGIDVFASASPDEIVLVNTTGTAKKVSVAIAGGIPVDAVIWQLHQTGPVPKAPAKAGTASSEGGVLRVSLPADSVTTLVVTQAAEAPKP
jgi:hypothetical protein